jgi:hypothetical protein
MLTLGEEKSNAEKKKALKAYKAHVDVVREEAIELAKSNATSKSTLRRRMV